ncbi:MAG: CcmD family protein [Ferruginibacter sp.]|nr:CcmD family protein [Ferruginibacter sp.]
MLLSATPIFAQDNVVTESTMRSNGKIYVVMAICVTILVGLFLYVASIDKKLGKIEKENQNT